MGLVGGGVQENNDGHIKSIIAVMHGVVVSGHNHIVKKAITACYDFWPW